jgi:hypothetical protein
MERVNDGLPCSVAEEMLTGGAESRWKGKHGGEQGHRGGRRRGREHGHREVSRHAVRVFFPFF